MAGKQITLLGEVIELFQLGSKNLTVSIIHATLTASGESNYTVRMVESCVDHLIDNGKIRRSGKVGYEWALPPEAKVEKKYYYIHGIATGKGRVGHWQCVIDQDPVDYLREILDKEHDDAPYLLLNQFEITEDQFKKHNGYIG